MWIDERNGSCDFYMYNLSTSKEIKITTNGSSKANSAIYGNRVVWIDYRTGNSDIYMYDISTCKETQITNNVSEKANPTIPTIYGNRIVWQEFGTYGNSNIYMYDLFNNTETQITKYYSNAWEPSIFEDRIVWREYRSGKHEIYLYNISTSNETIITSNASEKANPTIYGDRIVWEDMRNGFENWDIYMYNLSTFTETQMTTDESNQYSPIIYDDIIVWEDWRNGCRDIYRYNLSAFTVAQVTTDGSDHYNPAIYGDWLAWSDNRNGVSKFDIYACNLIDAEVIKTINSQVTLVETQITTNPSSQEVPAIYGDIIVWQDWRNGYSNSDIYMYNVSSDKETQITTNESKQCKPVIYKDIIVWEDWRNGYSNPDIYMYNLSTHTETQITNNDSYQSDPAIYGDIIVWMDYRNFNPRGLVSEIYVYNLSTCKETQITSDELEQSFPVIYGDIITWQEFGAYGDSNVYMYDLSTYRKTKITTDGLNHFSPAIWEDRVVWQGSRNNYWRILMYNISTSKKTLITTNKSTQEFPSIYGNTIVWTDDRNGNGLPGNSDIYIYNLSIDMETQVTTDKSDQKNPAIYGNKIVWEDWRNGNPDIYLCIVSVEKAELKPPVADFNINVTSGYSPLSVQFTDLSKNAVSRVWDFNNDGVTDSIDANVVYVYTAPGTYTVNLTVSNEKSAVSKTRTIDVLKKSSSGGSSGGGGGSPEPAKNVETKELSQAYITNGKAIKFDFAKNATCVMYVSFDSKKTAGKTTTIVEQLKNKSALVSELPEGEVYRSFNVWVGNNGFATEKNIENSVIGFRVEKAWIQDEKIDQISILLNRYNDKKWEQLPANLSGEDDTYLYFTSEVPGFSSFAITGMAKGLSEENETESGSKQETRLADEGLKCLESETGQTSEEGEGAQAPGFGIASGVFCLFCMFLHKVGRR
ncbi:cell surface protein [Methanosarcina acetivorans C2A]|uniref:Cell surface protein n=1 Tax=Methanosarcina acetivorans (strain ATCC 35395 / DSM 2834 / JCM 12185 / C2A) TaxID=188937 RepID=Q8TTE9_METAC|nr:cell surface protein [Methanosarcina acetivorans C2A]